MAQKIARDFAEYKRQPSGPNEQKLYTYRRVGEESTETEALVALDFREVIDLKTTRA